MGALLASLLMNRGGNWPGGIHIHEVNSTDTELSVFDKQRVATHVRSVVQLTRDALVNCVTHLEFVCWLVGCLTSQQHASVSQGLVCSDKFACCHTQKEVADRTFYHTQSQYTDTGPTSPSADPIMPEA